LSRLSITVDVSEAVPAKPESALPTVAAAALPKPVDPVPDAQRVSRAEERARQQAARAVEKPAVSKGLYAINLESALAPIDHQSLNVDQSIANAEFYGTQVDVDGKTWYRLRLGFFATEAEAEAALTRLRPDYPRGWVVRVSPAEHEIAAGNPIVAAGSPAVESSGRAPDDKSTEIALASDDESAEIVRVPGATASGLTAQQLAELMDDGRAALLGGDNDRAVQIYTKVLREDENAYSRQAQEYLGLARERKGQTAHAVAEYRRYLMLYPEGEDAARVRQRLAGLTTVNEIREAPLVTDTRQDDAGPWDTYGGVAQYYRRDVSQFDDQEKVVNQSSVLTDFDVVTRRRGDRFDFSSRATIGNQYDLLGEDEGPGNSTRIYYMYADVVDNERDLSARVGRQSLHSSGVLGRFDGAQISWLLRPNTRLNFVSGFPVDSSKDSVNTDRFFYGVSTDLIDIFELLDLSLFYNTEDIDGIEDRQAVGGELRYFDDVRSLIMLADYDISYGEMNSFVTLGNWAFPNRMTLNAMIDFRKSPLLMTRNALIGQPVSTIEELLQIFGEDEIRQLAEDRTGDLQTYSLGLSVPLFDRFQINADTTLVNYEGTPASGGVPGIPDADSTTYYSLTVVGSSLLMEQDTSILGLGYVDGDGISTKTLSVDSRYPIARGLRFNPRFRFSHREIDRTNSTQWTASPSLRLLYRFARRYELEFEVGGDWSNQKTETDSFDYNSYFIYAGYRTDF
jgi:tetratricopeptide (TPR) repeat protein